MKISIILPVYNQELYIEECLNSILNQTYKKEIEVIILNDNSNDKSMELIKEIIGSNKRENIKFEIYEFEENKRQGYARNFGLGKSTGEYILFLDSDDFLTKHALELMEKRFEKDTDFVLFDYSYLYENGRERLGSIKEFMNKKELINQECELILSAYAFYTVNKLYRKSFLIENDIKYGEGYLYEDFVFYINSAIKANKISLLQNPLYKIRVNKTSTTKTNYDTMIHTDSLYKAFDDIEKIFKPRNKISHYNLNKYLIIKSLDYSYIRTPKGKEKEAFIRLAKKINKFGKKYYVPNKMIAFNEYVFKRRNLQNENYDKIIKYYKINKKGKLQKRLDFEINLKNKIKNLKIVDKYLTKRDEKRRKEKISSYWHSEFKNDKILMFGFDYRYEGNSKYLYDYLKEKNYNVTYVLNEPQKGVKKYVKPNTLEFLKELYTSKIVIAESWVPMDIKKKPGQKWIQLWHGTPYKKLLFDSHEKDIMSYNKKHKYTKFYDIRRWDLLLSDSIIAKEKFETSFDAKEERLKVQSYPRVQWLKDNSDNELLKKEIKIKLGIEDDKKIITYFPTWRDYNHRKTSLNLDYLIDFNELKINLDEDYHIIDKKHPLTKNVGNVEGIIVPDNKIETQEILLISDIIITDYSSVIFDVIKEKNVYILEKDYELYDQSRGVYEDIRSKLGNIINENEVDLAKMINNKIVLKNEEKQGLYYSGNDNSYKEIENEINRLREID